MELVKIFFTLASLQAHKIHIFETKIGRGYHSVVSAYVFMQVQVKPGLLLSTAVVFVVFTAFHG